MRRKMIVSAVLAAFLSLGGFSASGQILSPKFGVRWGGSISIYTNYHYNYLTEENMRVDEKGYRLSPYLNGSAMVCAGLYVGKHISIGAVSGYEGVQKGVRVIPVYGNLTYYLSDRKVDTGFVFAEFGPGFRHQRRTASILNLGGGRRFRISPDYSLDFSLSGQLTMDQPDVVDSFSGVPVTKERLRYSGAAYASLNFSIAFSFR